MQSAAGGTSQRLKPAFATVCSRSRIPVPPPDIVPAPLIVVIRSSPYSHPCRACLSSTFPLYPKILKYPYCCSEQPLGAHCRWHTPCPRPPPADAGGPMPLARRATPSCETAREDGELGQKPGLMSIGKR